MQEVVDRAVAYCVEHRPLGHTGFDRRGRRCPSFGCTFGIQPPMMKHSVPADEAEKIYRPLVEAAYNRVPERIRALNEEGR